MIKILNDNNREPFYKWLGKKTKQMNYNICQWNAYDVEIWEQQPFEMQLGVYLDYLRDKFQVVLCVYTNASGFLWSVQNNGGTDLGWSGVEGGDCKNSGCWTSYESAFGNAFGLITKCSFDDYFKSKQFTHCGNYASYLKTL